MIDDGRRWLVSNPDRKFDFILMNTTFSWRANASNLLSRDFMNLVRTHLNNGGILYYNTTGSEEAMATGARAFPYGLRISNFLAVSESPFTLDKKRWKAALTNYKIDGHPVFDLSNPLQQKRFEEVLSVTGQPNSPTSLLESRASMLNRSADVPTITDNNMGAEWK